MPFLDYICPACNKPILGTNDFDQNAAEILFNHVVDKHYDVIKKAQQDKAKNTTS